MYSTKLIPWQRLLGIISYIALCVVFLCMDWWLLVTRNKCEARVLRQNYRKVSCKHLVVMNLSTRSSNCRITSNSLVECVPLAVQQTVWFVHGDTAHFTRDMKKFIDCHCLDRWITWSGPVLWPPRSPDLTSADVCLRGHLDGTVYSKLINMFNERCHWLGRLKQQ